MLIRVILIRIDYVT